MRESGLEEEIEVKMVAAKKPETRDSTCFSFLFFFFFSSEAIQISLSELKQV